MGQHLRETVKQRKPSDVFVQNCGISPDGRASPITTLSVPISAVSDRGAWEIDLPLPILVATIPQHITPRCFRILGSRTARYSHSTILGSRVKSPSTLNCPSIAHTGLPNLESAALCRMLGAI